MLDRNIDSILYQSYIELGNVSFEIAENINDGGEGTSQQNKLWNKAILIDTYLCEILDHVEIQNGSVYRTIGITDDEINKLLACLKTIANITDFPVAPYIPTINASQIINGSGEQGQPGINGVSSYSVVVFASDSSGTGLSTTPSPSLPFVAFKTSNTPIPITPSSFTGLWVEFFGEDGAPGIVASLTNGKILIGNASNVPTEQTVTGAISLNNAGVASINNGVITNIHINASAAIAYGKLSLSNSIVDTDISTGAAITRSKIANGNINRVLINNASGVFSEAAAINPNVVIVSNADGIPVHSGVSTSTLAFLDASSSIQTQLNNRLIVTLSPAAAGDIIYYNGSNWTNLPRGTNGQTLQSTATTIQWGTPTINGIPAGGTLNQVLAKDASGDFLASWHTIDLAHIPSITATATEINKLSGVIVTTAQINFLGGIDPVTSAIQPQIDNKLSRSLAQNAIFVGNSSNIASQLSPGSNGQVLQIVAGAPQWQTITGTGTVTSINVSGGTTGLSFTGGPITTSGTITASGTLIVANGGTGKATLNSNRILVGNGVSAIVDTGPYWDDTNSRLGIGIVPLDKLHITTANTAITGTSVFSGIYFQPSINDGVVGMTINRAVTDNLTHGGVLMKSNSTNGTSIHLGTTSNFGVGMQERFVITPQGVAQFKGLNNSAVSGTTAYGGLQIISGTDGFVGGITINRPATDELTHGGILIKSVLASGTSVHLGTTDNFGVGMVERVRINPDGKMFLLTTPTNDNTETSILVRQSDGEIQTRAVSTIGGVSDGDKGDITVTGSGATWTIDSNVLSSGTYTPTATISGNIDSVTPSLFMYTRIGDKVTVWGYLDVDVTLANSPSSFYLTLPIASDLTALEDLYGVGSLVTNSGLYASAIVSTDTSGNRADVDFNSGATTTSQPMFVTFTYKIK